MAERFKVTNNGESQSAYSVISGSMMGVPMVASETDPVVLSKFAEACRSCVAKFIGPVERNGHLVRGLCTGIDVQTGEATYFTDPLQLNVHQSRRLHDSARCTLKDVLEVIRD